MIDKILDPYIIFVFICITIFVNYVTNEDFLSF